MVRGEALAALWDILDRDTLRQCLCLDDHDELDINTSVGESILVKNFNLLSCNTSVILSSDPVGLRFLGMQFRLPWNIKKPISPDPYWTPNDGMPYIDAAYPFCPQIATADRTDKGAPHKCFGERDAALIFNWPCTKDVDERLTVSIQTNVFRDGLF